MSQKTWPEYPPPGPQIPEFKRVWLLAIAIFAAAVGFSWYAQQSRTEDPSAHQAAELRGSTDPSDDPKSPQQNDDAALADSLASSLGSTIEDGQPIRRDMPWAECLQYLDSATVPLPASSRIDVMSNENMRVVRLELGGGGSLLLTCTRADNTLTIMPSASTTPEPTAPPSKP